MKNIEDIIKETLGKDSINNTDDFFEIGGNSIKALILINELEKEYNISIPVIDIYEKKIVGNIISHINNILIGNNSCDSHSLIFNKENENLLMIPPIIGTPAVFNTISIQLQKYFNIIEVEYPDFKKNKITSTSIQNIAKVIFQNLLQNYKNEHLYILGYSMGGLISYEIAKLIEQNQNTKTTLILIDSAPNSMLKDIKKEKEEEVNTVENLLNIYKQCFTNNKISFYKKYIENNIELIKKYRIEGYIYSNIIAIEAQYGNYNMDMWKYHTKGKFQHSILQEDHFTIIKNNCIIQKIINLKKTL